MLHIQANNVFSITGIRLSHTLISQPTIHLVLITAISDIDEPQLPRKRMMPQRYEEGVGEAFNTRHFRTLYAMKFWISSYGVSSQDSISLDTG